MAYLESCLKAVLAQDYPDFEVLVVDNGSTDGSADFVAAQYPQVRLIRNARNLGFAAGNNIGLHAATGDVLVLLNQDTEVRPGWLAALVTALQQPGVGMVGSKAYYPDGRIQHAGGYVNARGEGEHYGRAETDQGQYDVARTVDFITGASLALSRQVYEVVGDLDEGFAPAYYEDVDWGYRVRVAGWLVVYCPESSLVHKESSLLVDGSHQGTYIPHRSRLRFVLKHWPIKRFVDEFIPTEMAWLQSLPEEAASLVSAIYHAYLYQLLHLMDVMEWRQRLWGSPPEEADILAQGLLTLRTVFPFGVVSAKKGVPSELSSSETVSVPAPDTVMQELRQRWNIQVQPFTSAVPLIGPLVAGFRQQWNRVSTEWYVRPLLQQQIEFNAAVVTMLERLSERLTTHDMVLGKYKEWFDQHAELLQDHHERLNQLQQQQKVLNTLAMGNGYEVGELAAAMRETNRLLVALMGQLDLIKN